MSKEASLQAALSTVVASSVGEALNDLSKAFIHGSQWHRESLARSVTPGRESPQENGPMPDVRSLCASLAKSPLEPITLARRLEVTLRGTFRTDNLDPGGSEACDSGEYDDALADINPRAVISNELNLISDSDDEIRSRMGFGSREFGATPTGRSSVPAIRGDGPCGGTLSAPPFAAIIDEGIELSSLMHNVEHQVYRILERSLRGPSRAASCEPQDRFRGSPCMSPPPQFPGSPSTSLCPSPSPRGVAEELNIRILLRLCHSRCGSSSAVLELTLDHSLECNEACGCRCWPTPQDAEARLLAYFARHSLLRLAATQPPVRVVLEPLTS